MKTARVKDKQIYIRFKFPYGDPEFKSIVAKIKSLPGRKFNSGRKIWTAPYSEHAIKKLAEWGFDLDNSIIAAMEASTKKKKKKSANIEPPDGLEYLPFQKDGIAALIEWNGRGLIADEMGMGKTVQGLGYLRTNPKAMNCVVVLKASIKLKWFREAQKWLPDIWKPYMIFGKTSSFAEYACNYNILFINYDILHHHVDDLKRITIKTVIFDECHALNNPKTKRTEAAAKLAKDVDHIIALSGTPITKKPKQFYPILNMLRPDLFNSYFHYVNRYCGAYHNGWGWNYDGASNKRELHDILKESVMLRRLKKDHLKDLSVKQRDVIPLSITNRVQYNKAISMLEQAMDGESGAALQQIHLLKKLAVEGKMTQVFDWIDNTLEEKDKLVIGAYHHWVIDAVMEKYKGRIVKVDGRDNQIQRQKNIDEFMQNSDINLFIGQIKAAGEGIDLFVADTTAIIEMGWSSYEHDQFEDRIHRYGQKSDSVNIYYLVADNTIENDIIDLLDTERKNVDQILNGEENEKAMLGKLLERYRNERKV